MTTEPYRVALVGVDGSGKTTVGERIRRRAGRGAEGDAGGDAGGDRVVVLHTIRAHEAPDGPLHALSRHLSALSVVADELASPELKIAVFYLQLSTYAPIERFFADTFRPAVVVADRHPVVDALAYLPLYGRVAAARPGPPAREPAGWPAAADPDDLAAATAWARRVGCGTDLWRLGAEMLGLYAEPPERLLKEFRERFGVEVPDRVVWLDLDLAEAMRRLGGRGRSPELHETRGRLEAVRRAYEAALAWLPGGAGPVEVRRLDCTHLSVDDVVDEILSDLPA